MTMVVVVVMTMTTTMEIKFSSLFICIVTEQP
jgi:hypothetical protein